ncbi:G-protein-coupled receptor [Cavenderia fasciculata]|uniref:G-protein-coupled receptor n=1 Tax=Cavenderia fasciculata TaxID=261658 RepID=F4PX94_CACFS|nr:G-protein-coupled receptor [Cavenderia fasciculata]EGG19897.1 G-protein-coupled receptor [Cavenderia fasciculata]|eukprot:XP_004366880.1 G-protein-coupled receptor [Cavenderia fasciculata]
MDQDLDPRLVTAQNVVLLFADFTTISIYLLIVKRFQDPERLEKYYYGICWGLPMISTIIMLAKNLVEPVVGWCWIGGDYTAYRFGIFYVPFFIIFATSAVLVGLTCQYTYKVIHNGVSDNKERHIKYQFKLVNYIIVFLVCWIFAVINRIINSLDIFDYTCNMLHTYLSISHGFYASIVFIYNNPLMWRYFGAKILGLFTPFGFCVERAKQLDRNKNNNNPSPYSSSRGVLASNKSGGAGGVTSTARGTSTGAGIDFDTEEPIEMIQITGADIIPSNSPTIIVPPDLQLEQQSDQPDVISQLPPIGQPPHHHNHGRSQHHQQQIRGGGRGIIGENENNNNDYYYDDNNYDDNTNNNNNNENNNNDYDYEYSPPPPPSTFNMHGSGGVVSIVVDDDDDDDK